MNVSSCDSEKSFVTRLVHTKGDRTIRTRRITVRECCAIGVFAAVIAICAQISIPMPYGVPMTLQTLAIPLAGIILGARNGTYASLVYMLIGVIGAPVFANFTGGPGVLLSVTGGFILSFPLLAFSAGIGARSSKTVSLLLGITIGTGINFLCGMLFFQMVTACNLQAAFTACVLPFIPTAILKIIFAAVSGRYLKKVMMHNKWHL